MIFQYEHHMLCGQRFYLNLKNAKGCESAKNLALKIKRKTIVSCDLKLLNLL